jgi:hypothetical protein
MANVANAAPNVQERQEFWKPIVASHPEGAQAELQTRNACPKCGAEAVLVGQFCHVCGAERGTEFPQFAQGLASWFDFTAVRKATGLGLAALLPFILGCGCVIAAAAVGFVYTASTVLEWQAIQLWRIEWLLAAIASFGAGLLLKKAKK